MTYNVKKSDGTTLISLSENTISTDACSLALVGRRSVNYGQSVAENFVKLLENHANPTAPISPLMGQFWFNKTAMKLNIYDGTTWFTIATITNNGLAISGYQLVSTCPSPVPPLIVASTGKVIGLNADLLDGYDSSITTANSTIPVRNSSGDIFANRFQGLATSALYADLAERFEASEPLTPGDVVTLGGDKEIRKASGGDFVLGIISTNPGFRMNEGAGDDQTHPFVAYVGRVPAKIVGSAEKFDRLYLSNVPGRLTPAKSYSGQPVIGRALEDGTDEIMVVYGAK